MPGPGQRAKQPRAWARLMERKRKNKGKKKRRPVDRGDPRPSDRSQYGHGDQGTGEIFPERPPGGASGGRIGRSSGGVTSWQDLVKKKYSS